MHDLTNTPIWTHEMYDLTHEESLMLTDNTGHSVGMWVGGSFASGRW